MRVSTELVASSRISSAGSVRNARGDRDQLALTGGEVGALLVDDGVVAVGQRVHEPVHERRPRGLEDLVLGRVRSAVGDVVADGALEEPGVLQHHPDLAAQRGPRHRGDVVAVDRDPAGVELVEPHHQVDQRGLAGAGRPDDRDRLAGARDQGQVGDERPVLVVAERHVLEGDLAPAARRTAW